MSTYEDKSPCIQGEFNFHYDPVTALYWKNSLVISGDASGEVCLWVFYNLFRMLINVRQFSIEKFTMNLLDS